MKLSEIYSFLNELSPFELQESWDNSGLIVGDMDADIERVYLSLEPTLEVLGDIDPNSLLITHHPLIFSPLKRLDFGDITAQALRLAVQKNISIVAMHTNYDKTHLNEYFAAAVMGFGSIKKDGFLVYEDVDMSFEELVGLVKSRLGLQNANCVQRNGKIQRVAIVTGSGASFLSKIDADCLITGDVKYHDAIFAMEKNIGVIDATHYATEAVFTASIYENLKILPIKAIITNSKNPLKNF
ncbi:MAG TPA: Nif3-like dinuclear metal center hexameric protein [Campylobacterales bacterium]|nr:Nif3-like dinuclear metal center hexameric protein [Campylobacterales bacterium]